MMVQKEKGIEMPKRRGWQRPTGDEIAYIIALGAV
jgi:hypothetical protein